MRRWIVSNNFAASTCELDQTQLAKLCKISKKECAEFEKWHKEINPLAYDTSNEPPYGPHRIVEYRNDWSESQRDEFDDAIEHGLISPESILVEIFPDPVPPGCFQ